MAPDPSLPGEGDLPAVASATATTNQPPPNPGLTPSHHRPKPSAPLGGEPRRTVKAAPRAGAPSARSGEGLQECLLSNFHNVAIPGAISPSSPNSPAFVWITPPSRSSRFNVFFVRNAVHFLLVAPPGRLRVFVFRVRVSCQNIANVLVVQGRMRFGTSVLLLHPSMEAAVQHASLLPPEVEDGVISQLPDVPSPQLDARSRFQNPAPVPRQLGIYCQRSL